MGGPYFNMKGKTRASWSTSNSEPLDTLRAPQRGTRDDRTAGTVFSPHARHCAGCLIGSSSFSSPGAEISPGDWLHIMDEHTDFQAGKDLPKVAELERS